MLPTAVTHLIDGIWILRDVKDDSRGPSLNGSLGLQDRQQTGPTNLVTLEDLKAENASARCITAIAAAMGKDNKSQNKKP